MGRLFYIHRDLTDRQCAREFQEITAFILISLELRVSIASNLGIEKSSAPPRRPSPGHSPAPFLLRRGHLLLLLPRARPGGGLVGVDKVPHETPQGVVATGKEEHVGGRDGGAAGVARKRLEVLGDALCGRGQRGAGEGDGGGWRERERRLPDWAQASSVRAPMNCGVALTPSRSDSSSTTLPTANHSAALRRCGG